MMQPIQLTDGAVVACIGGRTQLEDVHSMPCLIAHVGVCCCSALQQALMQMSGYSSDCKQAAG